MDEACSLGVGDMTDSSLEVNVQSSHLTGILLIIGKVLVSAITLVVNEKQLKELPLTIDAQNAITYGFGLVFLAGGVHLWTSVSTNPAARESNFASAFQEIIASPWLLGCVLLMTLLGVIVAYLLKAYSALEKEVFAAGVLGLLAIGQALTPQEQGFNVLTLECALVITAGSFAYRMNEPAPATNKPS